MDRYSLAVLISAVMAVLLLPCSVYVLVQAVSLLRSRHLEDGFIFLFLDFVLLLFTLVFSLVALGGFSDVTCF